MPTWRCPHCGAPQPESARCWVCRRSTTCCSTCRHFRRSVAGQLGYCGLDRRRAPLTGDEIRGCWQGASGGRAPEAPSRAGVPPSPVRARGRRVEFVPVGEPAATSTTAGNPPSAGSTGRSERADRILRFILWEDDAG